VKNKLLDIHLTSILEHFSTPLHFAQKHYGLDAKLVPFPSGTGHMVQSLQSSEIDVGIGLTEGWVNGLAKLKEDAKYMVVGSYVKTPLCWAISTGVDRDVTVESLKGGHIGISRFGSGSYVMSFVLADQEGWLADGKAPFDFVELQTFEKLRKGVNDGTADAFMWEHFTSKRYWDNGDIKRIGEIYTPWASWKIVASNPSDTKVTDFLKKLNQGVAHFNANKEEAVEYISTHLDYSADDARAWLKTVEFEQDVTIPGTKDIEKTVEILGKAGLLDTKEISAEKMIYSK
jgi:ABC-type nitrate/sulfonate/bicarbonate transport system substrate-binding protein